MEHTATIRDKIWAYLSDQRLTINKFAVLSGIHSGTLSRILKGQQAMAMSHLERITRSMGLEEDYFYSKYVDECLYDSAPNWRRLRPFILRSAELGRLDCIERLVQSLLDNLMYGPLLFDLAEELFQQGKQQAARILYENVGDSEKYQHSERLALCQYRLFEMSLGDDPQKNLLAATLFESYVTRLSEAHQLDALRQLIHVYYSLHDWPKADELAQEMHRLATIQYNLRSRSDHRYTNDEILERPLYYYILYAQLMRSCAFEELGDYKAALEFVPLYTDGSWIQEEGEEANRIIAQFHEWGTANTYLIRLMDGQQDVLDEYVNFVSTRENEIFTALFKIVETANRYQWDVDHILKRFSAYIPYRRYAKRNKQINDDHHTRFCSELATYYLARRRYKGNEISMRSVDLSAKIDNGRNVIKGTLSVDFEINI
ncbi:transcriptional regulator [Paenibacillus helianthi]|uniref:Transcriptional regulator n=1 Tax=Paenibacillus helianthi TaxID=1349432 RepID=A0ABX3EM12_9BACL|nr:MULTISPECIES: helix-turn-helix transcriptional regulator [Paenibacillus]OKP78156.1 transcriptional regulator [Paenibacillus sp. P3E]OKP85899.1 transcriptional regulator [Paenibacillus helianthi]